MEQKIFSYLPDSDSSILDQEGIEAIMAVLRDAFFEYFSPLFKFREDVLSTKILWCWKTPEGTLSKRISKMLYKEYKMELNEKTLTQIGNVARQYLPVAR
ncbi:MAG TPA: hypothetical protein VMV86_05195, partial [Methanosarcinales archaeon]|nr:hypothetical protein [Methanosarcinales archaeon]